MGTVGMLIYVVVIIGAFYFIAIRPQRKQEKERQAMVASVEVGDSILTTSGFYGVIIDMTDDVVIVEFGSNKNCRIPMKKEAIVEVEKAKDAGL
ncbi:MAG: preprotein translocase subunit YajC [Eubacterium sp.]|jgi:preprotein translocase subunit YajC|nr:preprotein translocase subunit YajC [Eubacterium sp.]